LSAARAVYQAPQLVSLLLFGFKYLFERPG
jgi:hypothetical protein